MIARFRAGYGSSPLHLLGHIVAFAAFVWALSQILGGGYVVNYIAWFVGAAVLHDIVVLPIYSLIDRITRHHGHRTWGARFGAAINYIRAPTIISAVLLLVYSPEILGYSAKNYRDDTGHALPSILTNWLLITAGLFLASGLLYGLRRVRPRLLLDEADLIRERNPSPD
jgi:Na+/melibiose symporter-like transporter